MEETFQEVTFSLSERNYSIQTFLESQFHLSLCDQDGPGSGLSLKPRSVRLTHEVSPCCKNSSVTGCRVSTSVQSQVAGGRFYFENTQPDIISVASVEQRN